MKSQVSSQALTIWRLC